MELLISLLGVIFTPICSIIVVLISVRSERSKKAAEMQRQMEQKAQEQRDKDLNDKLHSMGSKIDSVTGRFDDLEKQMNNLHKTDDLIHADIKKLASQQCTSGEYIHELSKLVTVVAEGMRDQHLDGNVTNAVAAFRKFERDSLSQLITKSAIEDSGDYDDD